MNPGKKETRLTRRVIRSSVISYPTFTLVSDKVIDDHCMTQHFKLYLNEYFLNFMQISYDAVMGESKGMPRQNSPHQSDRSVYFDYYHFLSEDLQATPTSQTGRNISGLLLASVNAGIMFRKMRRDVVALFLHHPGDFEVSSDTEIKRFEDVSVLSPSQVTH